MDMLLETRHIHLCSAFGKRSFTYLAPRCWNALPRDIRLLTALEHFKACLKSYLFEHFRSFCHRVNPYTTTAYPQTGSANSVFFVEPAPEDFDYWFIYELNIICFSGVFSWEQTLPIFHYSCCQEFIYVMKTTGKNDSIFIYLCMHFISFSCFTLLR